MQTPKDIGQTTSRVYHNVGLYKANYIGIMAMLAVYCIIVSPILLLALGFLAASTQAIM